MKAHEVLGYALNDYYSGYHNAKIIVHSPDFEPDEQDVSYYFREYAEMPELEKMALRISKGKILDVGAAAGSHSLELQKQNKDVTAIDISAGACEVMKKRGVKKIIYSDIFSKIDEVYDTFLMLMNGIGIVQGLAGLKLFLKKIKNNLAPEGQIICDSANLIYLFADNDSFNNSGKQGKEYFGEIDFEMEYKNYHSETFTWLYIDFDTLCLFAEKEDFEGELLAQDNHFQYLARLTLA